VAKWTWTCGFHKTNHFLNASVAINLLRLILSRVSDRRRGIGLTIGFIAPYNQLQLSLSGLSQSYNSRLNISQQFRSHRNRCNPGNRRTPGSLPSLDTNSLQLLFLLQKTTPNSKLFNSTATESSEVYDLWMDCRGDSAFGIGCLAIT
jgi:hypothetical protein